ncbi:MAG TPA: ABC transporter ATP-binding protein [Nitrososphaerales archaeon]|nr:ABC transporter ATP-binding protein [Nitrososphaerales archaeon]
MIELKGLSKHYQLSGDTLVKAVDNVNLTIRPGEFMMIVGRSGSGKTTLLSLIGGLTKPTSGTVNIDGVDIWGLNDATQSRFRAETIGFVFQIPSLLPTLSVLDNVKLPTMFSKEHDNVGERALSLLDMVGLPEKAHAYPSQLSVGQQKRVALARSLINEPDVVLADEPTSDLDKATELEIMTLIKKVHDDGPRTMVMVTHNLDLVNYATEVRTMGNGVLDEGTRK